MDKKPLKVLFLIDELAEWRGTETHLYRLLKTFDKQRIEPSIAVIGHADLAEKFQQAGISTQQLNFYSVFSWQGIQGLLKIRRAIKVGKIDLLVSYHTAADILAPLACLFTRTHCISSRRDEGFTKKLIHKKIQRQLNRFIDGMIAVSDAVATAVNQDEHYTKNLIHVIHNGENLGLFSPGFSDFRPQNNLDETHILILCVGGLVPIKDHHTLIQAYEKILSANPQARLVLAGDGDLRPVIESHPLVKNGYIRVLGNRSDIVNIIRGCDIYAQTSLSEGFSNAILQALACGLPAVVTHVGGNPELVDASCGYLVQKHDINATTGAINALINDKDLRQKKSLAARKKAEENGCITRMTQSYTTFFEQVCTF
jgi:glycosyltransferase involved in cell wall biosynthesis